MAQQIDDEIMGKIALAPRHARGLGALRVFRVPDRYVFKDAQIASRCDHLDGAPEMISKIATHARSDHAGWIEDRRKPLRLTRMPEPHLSSDITQEVRVMGDESESRSHRARDGKNLIELFVQGACAGAHPVADVAFEKSIRKCAAPTQEHALLGHSLNPRVGEPSAGPVNLAP